MVGDYDPRIAKYSNDEIAKMYEFVEEAATVGSELTELGMLVKPGDFYLVGSDANGLLFTFSFLRWVENGIEYDALLQPHWNRGDAVPVWKVVITRMRMKNGELSGASSGRIGMFKKENRKIQ